MDNTICYSALMTLVVKCYTNVRYWTNILKILKTEHHFAFEEQLLQFPNIFKKFKEVQRHLCEVKGLGWHISNIHNIQSCSKVYLSFLTKIYVVTTCYNVSLIWLTFVKIQTKSIVEAFSAWFKMKIVFKSGASRFQILELRTVDGLR